MRPGPKAILAFETFSVAVVLGVAAWALIVLATDTDSGDDSGLPGLYVAFLAVGSVSAVVGLYFAFREMHSLAALGLLVGIITPTFYFYVGNLLLVVCVVIEIVLAVKNRRSKRTTIVS